MYRIHVQYFVRYFSIIHIFSNFVMFLEHRIFKTLPLHMLFLLEKWLNYPLNYLRIILSFNIIPYNYLLCWHIYFDIYNLNFS